LWIDDFSAGNAFGWTLDAGWQIGSATTSSCVCNDPAVDHTNTTDNNIAGYIIGGCNTKVPDPTMLYMTSPSIDLSTASGTITLKFWRWLGADFPPFMYTVLEAYNGTSWNALWSNPMRPVGDPPNPCETSWNQFSYDISSYKTSNFQFRFGTRATGGGVYIVGGMNIDDVEISST